MSGGSLYGFIFYGILRSLIEKDLIVLHELQTVHAASVGCIITIPFVLLRDIHLLDTYLIDRPWHNVISVSLFSMIKCMETMGMFDMTVIESIFLPVFNANDIALSITMLDFYELTHIEFHIFTVDVHSHELIDLSYRSHPTWTVLECVYASCCVPVLFEPFRKDGMMYVDGGLKCNCPLNELMNDKNIVIKNRKNVVCIAIIPCQKLQEKFTFLEYILKLLTNVIHQNLYAKYIQDIHFIYVEQSITLFDVNKICSSALERKKLIDYGIVLGNKYLTNMTGDSEKTNDSIELSQKKKEEEMQKTNKGEGGEGEGGEGECECECEGEGEGEIQKYGECEGEGEIQKTNKGEIQYVTFALKMFIGRTMSFFSGKE